VLKGNSGISKTEGILPSVTLSQTLKLEQFRQYSMHSDRRKCCQSRPTTDFGLLH